MLWCLKWEQTNRSPIESTPMMYHRHTEPRVPFSQRMCKQMIRLLHHVSHTNTTQRNAMRRKNVTKVGPVSSIAPEG